MSEEKSVSEPKVSVHGIPQSKYDQNTGVQSGDGAAPGVGGWFKQHWKLVGIGVIAVVLAVIVYSRYNANSSTSGASSASPSTGGTTDPNSLWGSQLESDYQQLGSQQAIGNSLLQQIITNMGNPATPIIPVVPPVVPPPVDNSVTHPSFGSVIGLLPAGSTIKFGGSGRSWYDLPGSAIDHALSGDAFGPGTHTFLPEGASVFKQGGSWMWKDQGQTFKLM